MRNTKALAAVIIGNGIFGFSFLFSKLALEITVPAVLIAVRFTVAFIVLNLIVLIGRMIKKQDGTPLVKFSLKGKPWKNVLLLALFQPIIYFICENYGIVYTSSAFAGILIAVIPIAGIIFDVVIMHSKVTKVQVICAILSVVGVAITAIGAQNMKSSFLGIVLLLVAVIAGAMFYVFSKRSSEHYSSLERTYVMFLCGSVVYIIIALVQCSSNFSELILKPLGSPVFWIAIAYLAIVSSVGAYLLLNYGSPYVSLSQATIFANLTTVISILAGVLVLKENFSWFQGIGAVIILGSVYVAGVRGSKTE